MPHGLRQAVAALGATIWLTVALAFPVNSGAVPSVEIHYAPEDLPGERLASLYGKARRYI